MSRIEDRLRHRGADGRKGFIPFVTAGDPDPEISLAVCLKLAELGADVIELGVPFSDPMADGPTIQRSSQRALAKGMKLSGVLQLAKRFRMESDVPLVLFSYLNPILAMGVEVFAQHTKDAGIDGLLVTDAVDVEADEIRSVLVQHNIDLISLVAPTTSDRRLRSICQNAAGFIYAVSRAGVTGAQQSVSTEAEKLVTRARSFTDLPIAVGFGISTREQVLEVWRYSDAAVVGSPIVAEIEKYPDDPATAVERFVSGILPSVANTAGEL